MGLTQQAAAAQIPYRYREPPTLPYPAGGQGRGVPARLRMGEMAGPGPFGRLQMVTFWLEISAGEEGEGREGGRGTKKRRKTPVKPVCLSPSPPC